MPAATTARSCLLMNDSLLLAADGQSRERLVLWGGLPLPPGLSSARPVPTIPPHPRGSLVL